MNVLRDLTNSIAIRIKLIAFSGFRKNSRFFLKNQTFFQEETNFSTFWEVILFQLHPTANFLEKPIYVFSKKNRTFERFWDILLIQLQSASNWLLLAVSKKTQDFFEKPVFFSRRNQFFNVLKSPTISAASYNKFLSLAVSKKQFFFRKTHLFYLL